MKNIKNKGNIHSSQICSQTIDDPILRLLYQSKLNFSWNSSYKWKSFSNFWPLSWVDWCSWCWLVQLLRYFSNVTFKRSLLTKTNLHCSFLHRAELYQKITLPINSRAQKIFRSKIVQAKNNQTSSFIEMTTRTELQVKISTGHVKLQVYKHISVLCTSKNKSASLTSLYQDLDYTCKLIPKSKPIFQKISREIFKFKKISQRATIFALIFRHFLGTPENGCRLMPTHSNWCQGTREGQIGPFLGVSGPFSAIFQPSQPLN